MYDLCGNGIEILNSDLLHIAPYIYIYSITSEFSRMVRICGCMNTDTVNLVNIFSGEIKFSYNVK